MQQARLKTDLLTWTQRGMGGDGRGCESQGASEREHESERKKRKKGRGVVDEMRGVEERLKHCWKMEADVSLC